MKSLIMAALLAGYVPLVACTKDYDNSTVKEFDLVYDDTKDNNDIRYDDVRRDEAKESFPTEKLLSNTQSSDNCYVVPKMVE